MPIYHRGVDAICKERAEESARRIYDPKIEALLEEYRKTKNRRTYSKILKLRRRKSKHAVEAKEYYKNNFKRAKDIFVNKSDADKSGLRDFNSYLEEELKKI